jgi:RES domain-containing protein
VIPLPVPLGTGGLTFWRLDAAAYAATWETGEGSFRAGGRWNSRGVRAVYASLDPATAILEVAVHKGFNVLDTVPHVLTSARITDPSQVTVIDTANIPNSNWLIPGTPSAGQQAFGDALLQKHPFILLPSTVSTHSWNLIFLSASAAPYYDNINQEAFALDTRLNPALKP